MAASAQASRASSLARKNSCWLRIMSVYRKTMQGRMDAFNTQSTLSQGLRQLLLHVDGKTQFNRLQNYLGAAVCSEANINELIRRGYVRAVGYSLDDEFEFDEKGHSNDIHHRATVPSPLRLLPDLQTEASLSPTRNESISLPRAQDDTVSAERLLSDAKDWMADFVLMHIPQHAFSALKEIEQITSLAILASSVDAYELLTKSTGIAGKRHIQRLRRLTEDARQSQPQSYF